MNQWNDWRTQLPTFVGSCATLRELCATDAGSLMASITTDVARFVSTPPSSVEDFERFVHWTHRQREEGQCACFGIIPAGSTEVAGLAQIRIDATFTVAEVGFALAPAYWGRGIFEECTQLLLGFAAGGLRVRRVEAWVCVDNLRAMGALAKLGYAKQADVRRPFKKDDGIHEQVLWTLSLDDWQSLAGAMAKRGHRAPVSHAGAASLFAR